jgi:hypothetical protein
MGMKPGFLRKHLRRRPRKLLIVGLILVILLSPCAVGSVLLIADSPRGGSGALPAALVFSLVWMAGLVVTVWGARGLRRLERNRDVQALARYGVPGEVVDAIDAELTDEENVACVGRPMTSFTFTSWRTGELNGAQVLLTRSWLVHLWGEEGHRMNVLRLTDLMVVSRADARQAAVLGGQPVSSAVLIDRHDLRIEVVGTVEGITRLLANVLTRVPWALDRFEPGTERTWAENREQIITEVERRRGVHR